MNEPLPARHAWGLHGLLIAVAAFYGAGTAIGPRAALGENLGLLLLLAAGAATAAAVTRLDRSERSPRFALTFILAAFSLFPPPAGMLVAVAAAVAARGGGTAGLYRNTPAAFAPLAGALVVAQVIAGFWFAVPRAPSTNLVGLALLFLTIQFAAGGIHLLVGIAGRQTFFSGPILRWRPPVLELLNVPLAWLLAAAVVRGAWLQAVGVAGLALFIGWSLLRLGRALQRLRRTNDALASRLSELGTLHAIGREILSTLDPAKVFSIVERECGKVFEVDTCTIVLSDVDTAALSREFRRHRHQKPDRQCVPLEAGLPAAIAASKRPIRIDDCQSLPADSPFRGEPLGPDCRSVMAVPLIVEERVTGVIVLASEAVGAYDDHQISVLTTIAQQAAVAIENARNYQLATVDSLTGFYSRDLFFRRMEEEHTRVRRYGGEFGLLMLDLDGFKSINDRFGHLAGDRYLKGIAQTVREQLRDADLPCRYGGDEFCVLLPETDLAGAHVIAERIRDAVSSQVIGSEGKVLRTTISVGVAAFPDHDPGQLQGLVRNADEALYRAKRAGRNCVVQFAA